MSQSLLPERPLLISPTVAATIGLEQATMLQALADRTQLNGQPRPGQPNQLLWLRLAEADLQTLFPFWSVKEIQRIEDSLQQQGLLLAEADSQMPGYTW